MLLRGTRSAAHPRRQRARSSLADSLVAPDLTASGFTPPVPQSLHGRIIRVKGGILARASCWSAEAVRRVGKRHILAWTPRRGPATADGMIGPAISVSSVRLRALHIRDRRSSIASSHPTAVAILIGLFVLFQFRGTHRCGQGIWSLCYPVVCLDRHSWFSSTRRNAVRVIAA